MLLPMTKMGEGRDAESGVGKRSWTEPMEGALMVLKHDPTRDGLASL